MKPDKLLPLALISLVLLGMTGCPSPGPGTTTPTTPVTTQPPPTPTPTVPGPSNTIDISARGLRYTVSKITVPAGAEITVNFTNDDGIMLHNFSVYEELAAGQARPIFNGEVISDTTKKYFFNCDIHPDVMFGDFVIV